MILTNKIREALKVAARQHDGQKRKDNITPFIIHPFEVAWLVSQYTNNEDTISAALLHDVIEDTQGYSVEDIKQNFGDKVAEMVQTLTDPSHENLTWNELHQKCLEKIKASNDESILVFLADKYTTVSSSPINPDRLWYYKEIIDIAENREITKDTDLLKEFKKLIQE